MADQADLPTTLLDNQDALINAWFAELAKLQHLTTRPSRDDAEWRREFGEVLEALHGLLGSSESTPPPDWDAAAERISSFGELAVERGLTAADTATVLLSVKRPLSQRLGMDGNQSGTASTDAVWRVSVVVDRMAVQVMQAFVDSREAVVAAQHEELLELSVPVLTVWKGVLALPLVGTLDSARAQIVMETLLERVAQTRASVVILDITGVPTVDTLVAQHLIKTTTAAQLMGTRCVLSGIRPQIAQTMVQLGIEMEGMATTATLADALALAIDALNGGTDRIGITTTAARLAERS